MSIRYVWNRYDFSVQVKSENRGANEIVATDKPNIPLLAARGFEGPLFSQAFSNYYGYYTPKDVTSTISSSGTYMANAQGRYLFCPPSTTGISEISNQKVVVLYDAVQGTDGPYWHIGKGTTGYSIQCKPYGFVERWAEYSKGTTAAKVSAGAAGAHPADGRSGDYWYTYQGSDSIDPEAVTYSRNSLTQGEAITATITPGGSSTYGGTISYQYQYSINGGSTWTNAGAATTAVSKSITVPASAAQFQVRVLASDNMGFTSETYVYGDNLSVTPKNEPPTAPGSVTATESSPQHFAVSWTASTDPDGNLAGYQVERSLNNGTSWSTVTNSTTGTALNDQVAAGTASVIYRVRAFDTGGLYSGWTSSAAASVSNAPSMPASITLPSLVNAGEAFTVSWAAAADPDGDLTGYQVERSYNRGTTWTGVGEPVTGTSLQDIAAAGNATVMYRVRAVDAGGLYSAWKTSAVSTVNTAPEAPASVTVPDVINIGQSFTVRWTAASDAENNVTSYEVQRSYDGGAVWSSVSSSDSGTSVTITEKAGNSAVIYRIRAKDAGGLYSGWTAARSCPINLPPSAPPDVILGTVRLGEYMTVVWTASEDPDGTVESYILQRSVDGGSYETVYSGPGLTYTDRSDNRTWDNVRYRARAVDNQGGVSGWTASAVRQVEPGRLYLSGPEADLGRIIRSFDFTVTVRASGEFPVDGIQIVIALDGEERLRGMVSSGENASIRIDLWVTESGEHTITVTASKERYTQALGTYRFVVAPIELGEGGRLERLENRNGQAVYPITLMEGIFRRKDGKSLEEILESGGTGGGTGGSGGVSDAKAYADAAEAAALRAEQAKKDVLSAAFFVDAADGHLYRRMEE